MDFIRLTLVFFPNFNKFETIIHIHFTAFLLWFALIIIQPILIRKGKYSTHQKLGKLSYFLVPILVITILILVKEQTERNLVTSPNDALITAFIGLLDAVFLSIYYTIAMVNKQNIRWHVAFIIGATLVILNPGMSRLLNQVKPGLGLLASIIIPFIVPIVIIIVEKLKFKRDVSRSPYFYFLMFWTFEIILFITIPITSWWKEFVFNMVKPS